MSPRNSQAIIAQIILRRYACRTCPSVEEQRERELMPLTLPPPQRRAGRLGYLIIAHHTNH